MLITYSGDGEVLVCTLESEPTLLSDWFIRGKRDLEDYDRDVYKNGIAEINSHIHVSE